MRKVFLAAAVCSLGLSGCSSSPAPSPGAQPSASSSPSQTASTSPLAGTISLPAAVYASDDTTLTGCTNASGWLTVSDEKPTASSVVKATAPDRPIALRRPADAPSLSANSQYLSFSGGGDFALISYLLVQDGGATRPDKTVSVVERYNTATGAFVNKTVIPQPTLPTALCFSRWQVFEPTDSDDTNRTLKAFIYDSVSGKLTKSLPLRHRAYDNDDTIAGLAQNSVLVSRYRPSSGQHVTESYGLKAGKLTWTSPAGSSYPVLASIADMPYWVSSVAGKTIVLNVYNGKVAAAIPQNIQYSGKTWAIDRVNSMVYLTDGDRVAKVSLKTGKASALGWAKNLQQVDFQLIAAVANHLFVETKEETRLLAAASGVEIPFPEQTMLRAGKNWYGYEEDDRLTQIVYTTQPFSPSVAPEILTKLPK